MANRETTESPAASSPGFGPGIISVTVGSMALNTLNLAALADDFVEWREFFSDGVLTPYVNLREFVLALFPFEIPYAEWIINILVINTLFVVGARIGTYVNLRQGQERIPEYDNWRNDVFVYLIAPFLLLLCVAVSAYYVIVFAGRYIIPSGALKTHFQGLNQRGSLCRMSLHIVGFFLVALIPFFGLLFFATNAFLA